MRSARCFVALGVVLFAGAARAGLDGSVFLMPIEGSSFECHGEVVYVGALRETDFSAVVSGTHSVHGPQMFEVAVQGNGRYVYTLEGPAAPGACYGTQDATRLF